MFPSISVPLRPLLFLSFFHRSETWGYVAHLLRFVRSQTDRTCLRWSFLQDLTSSPPCPRAPLSLLQGIQTCCSCFPQHAHHDKLVQNVALKTAIYRHEEKRVRCCSLPEQLAGVLEKVLLKYMLANADMLYDAIGLIW